MKSIGDPIDREFLLVPLAGKTVESRVDEAEDRFQLLCDVGFDFDADGVNVELIQEVLRHIVTGPNAWNQSDWVCDTTACFAGWVLAIALDLRLPELIELHERDSEIIACLAAAAIGVPDAEDRIFTYTLREDEPKPITFADLVARVEQTVDFVYVWAPA
jgi:hypothetical protein